MLSQIAEAIKLKTSPVATIFSHEKPEKAAQFVAGRWGCVISLVGSAAKGRVAVIDRETVGCPGGRIGMGLCASYEDIPNGIPGGIEYFLSCGRGEGFPEGEGYRKTPEIARAFLANLPKVDIPYEYIIFKPLDLVDPAQETVQLVTFLANPDQLTALVTLANYEWPGSDGAIIPHASGCQSIGIIPLAEAQREHPRAVVGMLDTSARPFVDENVLSFTVPFTLFQQMEANVPGSFLERKAWKKVAMRLSGV